MTVVQCPQCGREIQTVGVGWCEACEVYTDFEPHSTSAAPGSNGSAECATSGLDDSETRVIVFPWPILVSVNARAGGMVGWTSKEYREARDAMHHSAQAQNVWPMLHGPVELAVYYHVPDNRRRDCSNLDKAVMDALEGVVYEDDTQVVRWAGHKMPVSAEPRAVIEVRALHVEQAA